MATDGSVMEPACRQGQVQAMDGSGPQNEVGKIFVGGLSWETTKENLQAYFEKYGEVSDSVIMIDPISKKPRGFGFITFKDPLCVENALTPGQSHSLDGKKIDPKRATVKTPGGGGPTSAAAMPNAKTKKIFLGGLAQGTKEEDVRAYFGDKYNITDVDLKFDKNTQRMRGFGFVGFESEDMVDDICRTQYHQINSKTVEVKKAQPRQATSGGGMSFQPNSYGGYSGASGGGGRGGGYASGYNTAGGYPGYNYGGQQQQQQQPYGAAAQYAAYGGQYGGHAGQYGAAAQGYVGYGGHQATTANPEARTDYSSGFSYGGAGGVTGGQMTEATTGTGTQQQMTSGYPDAAASYQRSSYPAASTDGFGQPQQTSAYDYSYQPQQQYSRDSQTGYSRGGSSQSRTTYSSY